MSCIDSFREWTVAPPIRGAPIPQCYAPGEGIRMTFRSVGMAYAPRRLRRKLTAIACVKLSALLY